MAYSQKGTTMPNKTKAQLQQEILDLQQQVTDLNTQVTRLTNNNALLREQLKPHMIAQAIQSNNTPAKQEQHTYQPVHTDGINNSDERVREPIHKMDPIEKDPNPPSYKQLSKLAYYYATYKLPLDIIERHRPTNNLEASFLLTDIHTYVNSIPYKDRPFNDYSSVVSTDSKDEFMAARQLKQQITLCKLIAKYGSTISCRSPFCKEFSITQETYDLLIDKAAQSLAAYHQQKRQEEEN